MIRFRTIALPAVLALALALGAGCKRQIDNKDAASKIKTWAEESVAPVSSVSCPKTEMKAGTSFDCDVTFAEGATYKLTVTQNDAKGNVAWKWATPVVGAEKLGAFVTASLKEQSPGANAQVDCGTGLKEMPADGITCKLDADGAKQDIVIRLEGDSVAWEIK